MDVSVVMSTRDRGDLPLAAVESIFAGRGCLLELILIDQSASDSTERTLQGRGLLDHDRLTYQRSSDVGLSRGRNEGIRHARGEVIAFTDDDCVAPPNWAADLARRFATTPDLAVLYASVVAPPDSMGGWIPQFHPLEEGYVQWSPQIVRSLGIGANFAVRRSAFSIIGPFDEFMGAGTDLTSGEDTDFGYRALASGLGVFAAAEPGVTHYGVRRGNQSRATASSYLRGMGAMCMKHVRCGDIRMLRPLEMQLQTFLGQGTSQLFRGRRPSGYGSRGAAGLLSGAITSFRFGVDKQRRLYLPRGVNAQSEVTRELELSA